MFLGSIQMASYLITFSEFPIFQNLAKGLASTAQESKCHLKPAARQCLRPDHFLFRSQYLNIVDPLGEYLILYWQQNKG